MTSSSRVNQNLLLPPSQSIPSATLGLLALLQQQQQQQFLPLLHNHHNLLFPQQISSRPAVPAEVTFLTTNTAGAGRTNLPAGTVASAKREDHEKRTPLPLPHSGSSAFKQASTKERSSFSLKEPSNSTGTSSTTSSRRRHHKIKRRLKRLRVKLKRVDKTLLRQWEQLMYKRPRSEESDEFSAWLMQVTSVSARFQEAKQQQSSRSSGSGKKRKRR